VRPADTARLLALAAIWGAAFISMRVIAPVLGPVWTAEGRVLIGGLALAAWFALTGFDPQWRRHLRFYAVVGVINSAIPFSFYGFASMHLPASLMAILNATSPMFGLLLGAAFAGERITPRKVAGLVLGAAGVTLVVWRSGGSIDAGSGPMFGWAVAACLGASFAYGVTGVFMKHRGAGIPSRGVAVGSQLCAAAALVPLLPLLPPVATPSALVAANLVVLGVFASGVAFILYFRLMTDVGATRALTVTFLVPLFAFLWGMIFLGETLTWGAIGGALLILAGTRLVTR
jgi:drug/metabolite transporter (DMT)-like permease